MVNNIPIIYKVKELGRMQDNTAKSFRSNFGFTHGKGGQ